MARSQFANKKGLRPPGYYTYAYLRANDSVNGPKGSPWYIGKGEGDRAWGKHGSRGRIWMPPVDDQVLILKWGMSEPEAFAHEAYLIAIYGNALVGGLLTKNFTDGGEGCKGYRWTEDQRQKLSEQQLGKEQLSLMTNFAVSLGIDPDQYVKLTPIQRKAIRERVQSGRVHPDFAFEDIEAVGRGPGYARQFYSAKNYGIPFEAFQALSPQQIQLVNSRYAKGVRCVNELLAPPQEKGSLLEDTERHLASKYEIPLEEWACLSKKQKVCVAVRYRRGARGEDLWGGLKEGINQKTWRLAKRLELDPVMFASLSRAARDSVAAKFKYYGGQKRGKALLEGLI